MRALLDLSTVPAGHEQLRFDNFRSARPDVNEDALVVVVAPDRLANSRAVEVPVSGDPGQIWAAFDAELQKFLGSLNDEPALVASFQRILESRFGSNTEYPKVEYYDLRQTLPNSKAQAWPEAYYPLKGALKKLELAIQRNGGTVRMTNLRPALTILDQKFKKNVIHPTPLDAPGCMGILVQEAVVRGIVRTEGHASNPFISLTANAGTTQAAQVDSIPHGSVVESISFERESDRYVHLLRKANLGPFQQVRWAIYDALEESLANQGAATVGSLLDCAVKKVRSDVESARVDGKQYLVRMNVNLPWSQVRSFLGLLCTRAPVLQTAQGEVRADWSNLGEVVTGLVDSWRQVLDAQLVVYLIDSGCSINQYTEVELSGAIYNSRLKLENVQLLLQYLLASQVCEWTEDYSELRIVAQ